MFTEKLHANFWGHIEDVLRCDILVVAVKRRFMVVRFYIDHEAYDGWHGVVGVGLRRTSTTTRKRASALERERARSLYAVKVERSHHVAGDFGLPPAVFFSLSPPIHVHLNLVKFQTFLRPDTKRFPLL